MLSQVAETIGEVLTVIVISAGCVARTMCEPYYIYLQVKPAPRCGGVGRTRCRGSAALPGSSGVAT